MTYIDEARQMLQEELQDCAGALLDLYLLLVLTKGVNTSRKDVHDAWAVWRSRTDPGHRSIVPFEELTEQVQALDQPYVETIVKVSYRVRGFEA